MSRIGKSFLQSPLNHAASLLLKDLPDGVANLLGVRSEDTSLLDDTIKNELSGDSAGETDGPGHGGVTSGLAVRLESGGKDLLLIYGSSAISDKK